MLFFFVVYSCGIISGALAALAFAWLSTRGEMPDTEDDWP